jgi:mycothiol synthase
VDSSVNIGHRKYHGEVDYQRVRELLMESYAITRRLHNWELARWDSFRFGARCREETAGRRRWEADVHLWETDSGKLIGVVNPEDRGNVFLQIHPHFRHIEGEMLTWAEQHHRAIRPKDAPEGWPLHTFAYEYDEVRGRLLTRRGYENLGPAGMARSRPLNKPIPSGELPAGYVIRDLRGEDGWDQEQLAAVINVVFNASITAETIRLLQHVPTQRQDLVVVAPDGTFAAFCAIWFDEVNRIGAFEPVGTHPDHRRRGLARAMMCRGLQRLKAWGALVAYVGTGYDSPANRLYELVGFTSFDVDYRWRKEF